MTFQERVRKIIKSIPKGSVMSYGQVAAFAGSPGAARQVGFVLRSASIDELPWWRVVNSAGVLSIKGSFEATKQLQKDMLQREGVVVSEECRLDIEKYRYQPTIAQLSSFIGLASTDPRH